MRKPFSYYHTPGLFWFRIFGKGIHVKDVSRHRLMFSEREGYTNFWAVRRLK